MTDPLNRFSNRVDNYVRYRPGYPPALIDILKTDCGLTENSTIADVGSGTGILSKLFLQTGNTVFGVEPNKSMREAAERLLDGFPTFVSTNGTAEATTLEASSVDFVMAGQAFHWFHREKARKEFARILKPGGWVILVWNERRLDSTPFLKEYENLLLQYGTDYKEVRHENVASEIGRFFAPADVRLKTVENIQHFDFVSLKGRLFSASYTPAPGDSNFEPMLGELKQIFDLNESNGIVSFEYDTKIYYGHLVPL